MPGDPCHGKNGRKKNRHKPKPFNQNQNNNNRFSHQFRKQHQFLQPLLSPSLQQLNKYRKAYLWSKLGHHNAGHEKSREQEGFRRSYRRNHTQKEGERSQHRSQHILLQFRNQPTLLQLNQSLLQPQPSLISILMIQAKSKQGSRRNDCTRGHCISGNTSGSARISSYSAIWYILRIGRMASQKTTGSIGKNGSRTSGSNNDPENIKGRCRSTRSTRNRSDRTTEECKEQGRGHPDAAVT